MPRRASNYQKGLIDSNRELMRSREKSVKVQDGQAVKVRHGSEGGHAVVFVGFVLEIRKTSLFGTVIRVKVMEGPFAGWIRDFDPTSVTPQEGR